MNYSIFDNNRLKVTLKKTGETIFVAPDKLVSYQGDIKLESTVNISFKNFFSSLGGKSVVTNKITALNKVELLFSSTQQEHLHALDINNEIIYLKPASFFAFLGDFEYNIAANLQKLISGENLIMLKIRGKGTLLFTSNGGYDEYDINSESTLKVEEACLLLYDENVTLKPKISSVKNIILSDEGYLLRFEGSGKIFVHHYRPTKFVKK